MNKVNPEAQVNPVVPASCAHHQPQKAAPIQVPIGNIEIPEFYVHAIPDNLKPLYNLLGIKFVCVKFGQEDYFIFEPLLAAVVKNYNLQAVL